jgi:hypothetical protein
MEFEAAERQKLVSNEDDLNDLTEVISHNTSSNTATVQKQPSSPVISSSKNSFTNKSSERTSESKINYYNERKYDFRSTKKRIQKGMCF